MYGLYTRGYVHEDGTIEEESLVTRHPGLDEIYWFRGKHNYGVDTHFICEIEFDGLYWTQIEGTEIDK